MKNHLFLSVVTGSVISLMSPSSYAFLDALKKNMDKLGSKIQAPGQAKSSGSASPKEGSVDAVCSRVLGAPYQGTFPPGTSAEELVGKFFNVSVDLGQKLREGISVLHVGAMPNIEHMVRDIHDQEIRRLGEAFVRNPTLINLAHIINKAESGDRYKPEDGPSQYTEARTLLALTIMQFSKLAKNPNLAAVIFRENFLQDSGLSIAMMARLHLFGELGLAKDINAFSNYVGQASNKYSVSINDQSIFYALGQIPNWRYANQYRSLLQQSQQMAASLNRSNGASQAAPTIRKQALALMEKGHEIDNMTLDALGAGPTIAQFRARGERMKKEEAGEANLVKFSVTTSAEYRAEFERLLSTSPKLSDDATKKLADANQKRLQNLGEMYKVTGQVALLFFNGNIAETQEIGGYVNDYFRRSCETTFRTIQFAQEAGVPQPTTQISRDGDL